MKKLKDKKARTGNDQAQLECKESEGVLPKLDGDITDTSSDSPYKTPEPEVPLQAIETRTEEEYLRAAKIFQTGDKQSVPTGTREFPHISIVDFAGQEVFYSSQQVFYTHRSIYGLTMDLTKPLKTPLKVDYGSRSAASHCRTELDFVDYHLESIRAHTRPYQNDDDNQDTEPPVIVIGTHKDQVDMRTIRQYHDDIRDHLDGKVTDRHVEDRYFAVDNTKRNPEDPEISELRAFILDLAKKQPYMGERIPIKWLELKSKLMDMKSKGMKFCTLEHVITLMGNSQPLDKDSLKQNAVNILKFFHLCGDIIFLDVEGLHNFVILSPQWFVDVCKTIITVPQYRDRKVKEKWRRLEKEGVLEDGLINHVWTTKEDILHHNLMEHKQELLAMMDKFDLILRCSSDGANSEGADHAFSADPLYFVPSLLTEATETKVLYPTGTSVSKPISIVFDGKFFPIGLYYRLIICSMRRYGGRKPVAYGKCAKFVTSNAQQTFVITKQAFSLTVELVSSVKDMRSRFSHGPSVREGLDTDLKDIIKKWIPGIRYRWGFECRCEDHKRAESMDTSNFIPVTEAIATEWFQRGEVVCDVFSPATSTVQDIGLACWFTNQCQQHAKSTRVTSPASRNDTPVGIGAPVILLICDLYGTSTDGSSTINRQVAQLLSNHGAIVCCAVLHATDDDKVDASADNVRLILPTLDSDDGDNHDTPSLNWLTKYHSIRYPDLPQGVSHIIGHTGMTDEAANRIKEDRYPQADLIIVNQVMPEDTEYYKGVQKSIKAAKKGRALVCLAKNADAIFSIGKRVFDHFETKYRMLGNHKPERHHVFLPRPSKIFEETEVRYGGGEMVVLSVGKVIDVDKLKGHDLAAGALGKAAKVIERMRYCVRGVSEDDWEATKKLLEDKLKSSQLKPTLLPYGSQQEISEDITQAHLVLMPSRAEPFGLVGLEAIAAGIPVLISDQSGLADMMKSLIKKRQCSADFRRRIVETSVNDSDDNDTGEWAKKIIDTLQHCKSEFSKAAQFKRELLASRYWEDSHRTLLQACGITDAPVAN